MHLTDKEHFLRNFTVNLKFLNPATTGNWGKMNAWQMAEHLAYFFRVSSNKIPCEIVTPEEYLPKYREFLLSDKHFRENTKAPASVLGDEPLPVNTGSYEEALNNLAEAADGFFDWFEAHPGSTTAHPAFGNLSYDDWLILHYKHVSHHMRQFNISA